MAYKQNNPFSRKASPLNNENDLYTQIRGKRYFTRPIGDDERFDHDMVVNRKIDEKTGHELVSNRYGGRGARVDYLPTQESLGIDDAVYNTAKEMVRDSLNLVNKGHGVTATSLYGENLAGNLRKSRSGSGFEDRLMQNLRGIDDKKNFRDAKIMEDRSGSGWGENPITGEMHVDFGHGKPVQPGYQAKEYRRRKGFID